jgi:hypothetical protein
VRRCGISTPCCPPSASTSQRGLLAVVTMQFSATSTSVATASLSSRSRPRLQCCSCPVGPAAVPPSEEMPNANGKPRALQVDHQGAYASGFRPPNRQR